ncbi:MAG: ABC transporter ATP-binding protein [Acidobacteriota bacterium]
MEQVAKSAVVARGLTKRFGTLTAVDGISFSIHEGECFGFLGPNGAGKTSTMRMIYGFSPITAGELRVLGRDVRTQLREIKARLGVIPQEDNLDPDLKVLQNLLVYARYYDLPRRLAAERGEEALHFVQLWERRDEAIRNLSGGMRRRLTIARALINRPDLLIADEPTTGLDPQARHVVWQKLRALRAQGVTLLLTTHYMDEAAHLCDRVAVMDGGRILDVGSPPELIRKYVPAHVLEIQLRPEESDGLRRLLDAERWTYEAVGDVIYVYADETAGLERRLEGAPEVIRTVRRTATLEDVFLKLTGRALRE